VITFFLYLLNVNIGLIILFLGHHFLLQKSHHFLGIRYYFLFGFVACLAFPLMHIENVGGWQHTILKSTTQLNIEVLSSTEDSYNQNLLPEERLISLFDISVVFYWVVTFLILAHLIIRIYKLYCIVKQSKLVDGKGYRINLLSKKNFTFLNYVVLGSGWAKLPLYERDYVLIHENHHARGLHSIDILLFHIIKSFCWFNPIVWILGKSISLNHEFLVDDQMIQQGISIEDYASLLIDEAVPEQQYPIFQPLSQFSNLKKRINMMTESKSKSRKISIWLAIPILTIILFACNLTDISDTVLETNPILEKGEKIAFFFEGNLINLNEGISKEKLSNTQDDVFRLLLEEDDRKNLKSLSLTLAKGRKSIGSDFKLDENFLKNAYPEDIQFNLINLGISDSIKAEGVYRLIVIMEIISPGFDPDFYESLKRARRENQFSPYTDEEIKERHLALKVDFVNSFAQLRTEEDFRAFATDVVTNHIYSIRIE